MSNKKKKEEFDQAVVPQQWNQFAMLFYTQGVTMMGDAYLFQAHH